MNAFKLELRSKTILQKLAMGAAHIAAMDGNANYPVATRVPTDAQFLAAQEKLRATAEAAKAAENAWRAALATRAARAAEWDRVILARASHCEAVTPGNLVALATTGLPLRSPRSPVGPLPAPANLRATMSDMAGQIHLQWEALRGASTFIVECREHGSPQPWQLVKILKQCRCTSTGHTSGKTYSFRVRALGTQGEGPWSDESVKMAP
jgi:hypothetical protein